MPPRLRAPPSLLALPAPLRPLLLTHNLFSTTAHPGTSIDASEISHFNALASTWWDPHGPSRLLHLMNPLRHAFIARCHTSQPTPLGPSAQTSLNTPHSLHYLDVGCGGGIFAESAARLPNVASVTGVDPSAEVLAVAKAHLRRDPLLVREGRLRYLCHGIEELPVGGRRRSDAGVGIGASTGVGGGSGAVGDQKLGEGPPGGGYDVVTLFEVLEHVTSPSTFLSRLTPHVAPGGWLVLSTIARTWTSWLTTVVAAEEVLRIVPRGTHDWRKYVDEGEVREWFRRDGGWESPRAVGVVYVPGWGWREVVGGEEWGNYFFGVRRRRE